MDSRNYKGDEEEVCTISDTEFKELIRIGRETDRYEFLLESCFFDYIGNLVKDDEDAKQELILKLIESFDKFDLESDKNYDLLKYYRYRLTYWLKQFNIEKNGIIKRGDSLKVNNLFKKDEEILTNKELYDLQKYKNIKHMDELKDNECELEDKFIIDMEKILNLKLDINIFLKKLNNKQKNIFIMRVYG